MKITAADIYAAKLKMEQERPKPIGVYDGSIPYGVDAFAVIGLMYKFGKKLFGKKDINTQKNSPRITFKAYVAANLSDDYFIKELKLEPHEIKRFITFCNIDPKSHDILRDVNILKVMDFLEEKSLEFKKLQH